MLTNDELYKLFSDETNEIFGFASIKRMFELSYPCIETLKQQFYNEYPKETSEIYKILLNKKQNFIGKKLKGTHPNVSEQGKLNRANGIRKFWQENEHTELGLEIKETSRNSMKRIVQSGASHTEEANQKRVNTRWENFPEWHTPSARKKNSESQTGKIVSEETKKKQSEAAIRKFESGWRRINFKHSPETLLKMSKNTKKLWEDGVFTKTNNLFNSKGQQDLTRILEEFFFTENEVLKNTIKFGKSWDIIISEKNIIFEYNGTYWHYDIRFYNEPEFYDEHRKLYVKDVWEKDVIKRQIAIDNGFKFFVVWQFDWEQLKTDEEKINLINKMINNE